MRQYHMQTARVGFSYWQPVGDFAFACTLWQNPEVCRYITAADAFTDDEILARLQREDKNRRTHGIQYWPLFLLETGEFIGCAGLCPCEWEPDEWEFGIHLLPKAWGQGLGAEVSRAVLQKARESGRQLVWAGHHPDNDGSRALLQKLGFVHQKNSFYPPTGLEHPSYKITLPYFFVN